MTYKLALLAAAAALSLNAQATVIDWTTHGALELAASITTVGAFEDTYLFALLDRSSVFSTTVSNNLTGMLGISNGTVELFREAGAVDVGIGSFSFDGGTGNVSHGFGALDGGDYYYRVTGLGTGSMGGFYTVSSNVTAVPEPETYVLLLAGLGALGFTVRRRRLQQR